MEMNFRHVALMAVMVFFVGCDEAPEPAQTIISATVLKGKTMGTFRRVSVADVDDRRTRRLQAKIQTQLDADDQLLSTYKNDSAPMRLNLPESLSPWPANDTMADTVTPALRIDATTNGVMDTTVGPLVNLWGFGPDQQPLHIPTQAQIGAVKA